MKSIEEQLSYLFESRSDRSTEFARESAMNHLLDTILDLHEKRTAYVYNEGNYPISSAYCELLWDKAVSAILLEQKVTIVESAYAQWRWLESMRQISITAAARADSAIPSGLALVI